MNPKNGYQPTVDVTTPPPGQEEKEGIQWVTPITWDEFRDNGMLFFVNQQLHVLGLAITITLDDDGKVTNPMPARVKFRGFDDKSQTEQHIKIANYIAKNAQALKEEAELP